MDRAVGALVGLAVGDALGTTLEFTRRDSYPPLDDMIGGGPFGLLPGEWTDDTSMALCLAESLLANDGFDPADLMRRFVRWWQHGENSVNGRCFDIGITTRTALARFQKTGNPLAGDTDPMTAGNGSIMRLAPVVLRWFQDPKAAIEIAELQSQTTHAAPAAVAGCRLLADLLRDLIESGDKAALWAERASDEPLLAGVAGGSWKRKNRDQIRSSGYVVETLEAAMWAVNEGADFRDALLLAVNLGGDADTVGAVAGQIAGALWGASGIPPEWRTCLAWNSQIEALAADLWNRAT
ncbi:ADP-ribosylglycohydrolase family protein [Desertibaculum subflavum]|uniref:ADP-ribosylglycohydrolase family protein n=1 Tax=Desertibaculum subflavum TaxID=2268458 RepID=UPI000E66324B